MNRIYDEIKFDIGYNPATIASTSDGGDWYRMSESRAIGFAFTTSTMATGNTVVAQIRQAQSHLGIGAKDVSGATATITANVNVQKARITLETFTAGSTITINGLVFTGHATTTTYANREFSISGTDTEDAIELAACINDETYGVPGVTAITSTKYVILTADRAGDGNISVTGVAVIGVADTLRAIGYVEIEADQIDTNNNYKYIGLQLTTNASIICSAFCLRDRSRYTPTQYLAAEKLGV